MKIGEKYIKLDTPGTSLIFCRYQELLEIIYYGVRLADMPDYQILSLHQRKYGHSEIDDVITANTTFSCYGMGCDRQFSVLLKNFDGGLANKFSFVGARSAEKPMIAGLPSSYGAKETLELEFLDENYGIALYQYYSVFDDTDAIAVSTKLVNRTQESFVIKSLFSCQLDLDETGYDIYTYPGAWGRERRQNITHLDTGVFVSETKCGMSSHSINPFLMLKSPSRIGGWYGLNLIYSGNHKEVVDASPMNITRVMIGINDFGAEKTVRGKGSFHTPEAVMVYGREKNDIAQNMHRFVNGHIIPIRYRKERPVAYNIWGALDFSFDGNKLRSCLQKASELGMELFVVDDGWFGRRDSEKTSLGDWWDNVGKTGNLSDLAQEVHRKGMKFGLWVEPEMISPDSDLFREHPEYVLRNPRREPVLRRNQFVLDLTYPAVEEFILQTLDRIIGVYGADYIKWDCNRTITDAFGMEGGASEDYFFRYTTALYRILKTITEKYPHVLFEGCASGGGRFDLGMLCYMPQIWTSDMTDPAERVLIQEGTLDAYPPSCVSAHVARALVGSVNRYSRLSDRFCVAIEGVLGYELDLFSLSPAEEEEIKGQIAFYKKYRQLLQYGTRYNIESAFDGKCGIRTIVSEDKQRAIACIYKMKSPFNREQWKYRFAGLDEHTIYKVSVVGTGRSFVACGDLLNAGKLDLNGLIDREWTGKHYSEFYTLLLAIEKN